MESLCKYSITNKNKEFSKFVYKWRSKDVRNIKILYKIETTAFLFCCVKMCSQTLFSNGNYCSIYIFNNVRLYIINRYKLSQWYEAIEQFQDFKTVQCVIKHSMWTLDSICLVVKCYQLYEILVSTSYLLSYKKKLPIFQIFENF